MMQIYKHRDYKALVLELVESAFANERGIWQKLATKLNVHATLISQVFRGDRDLSPEHAIKVADFFGLKDKDQEFFVELVLLARAGSEKLKELHKTRLQSLQEQSFLLGSSLDEKEILSEFASTIYYSSWHYSAVYLMFDIASYHDQNDIAKALGLDTELVRQTISFLKNQGLLEEIDGKLAQTKKFIYAPQNGNYVSMHHVNYRMKAMAAIPTKNNRDFHFTCPVTVSEADALKIRDLLRKAMDDALAIVQKSPSEKLVCINLDMFEIAPTQGQAQH